MSAQSTAAIDPAVERQLRVAVERAVRPVWSEELRKLRMRKELLGHATAAYEDELRRDPDGALERSLQRMGDPAALAAELQSSVPLSDRWAALVDWAVRRPRGGSHTRHALWMGCLGGGLMFIEILPLSVLAEFDYAPESIRLSAPVAKTVAFIVATFGLIAGLGAYYGGQVRDDLKASGRRLGWRVVGIAATSGLMMWLIGHVAWLAIALPAQTWSAPYSGCWTALSVFFAASTIVLSWLDLRARCEIEEWLELTLD